MIRGVHMNQRADQMRTAAGQHADPLLGRPRHQRGRPFAIAEDVRLPADGKDVGVPGDDPEGFEIPEIDPSDRVGAAQPAKGGEQLMLTRIGLRRNDQTRRLRRNGIAVRGHIEHAGSLGATTGVCKGAGAASSGAVTQR